MAMAISLERSHGATRGKAGFAQNGPLLYSDRVVRRPKYLCEAQSCRALVPLSFSRQF